MYEVATFIYKKIICRHGCPRKILTNRETHFNNKMIEELMKKFNIKHNFLTPYHPKTNKLVERFNKILCESLAKLAKERNNWNQYIALLLFAYNTSRQNLTKIEPFYLTYGKKAILPIDNEENITETSINERIQYITKRERKSKRTN